MPDLVALTAAQLLAIPLEEPERLFSRDRDTRTAERRALARAWHSDGRRGDPAADRVLAHVNALHDAAEHRDASGKWRTPNLMELRLTDGRIYRRAYRARRGIEGIGEMFVGDAAVTIRVVPDAADLFESAVRTINSFRFRDAEMRERVAPCLPLIERLLETEDGPAMVLTKSPDLLLLRDVLDHFGGRMPARHVGWVLNRLYHITCWLGWAGLTHNGISADTVFVSAPNHSAAVLGGWLFAAPAGGRLAALPPHAAALAPAGMIASKTSDPRLDLTLVRALGRELLGDRTGMWLDGRPDVPPQIAAFLRGSSGDDAPGDFGSWKGALADAFGPPRFERLELTAPQLYA